MQNVKRKQNDKHTRLKRYKFTKINHKKIRSEYGF